MLLTTLLTAALRLAPVLAEPPQPAALSAFIAAERARSASLPPRLPSPPPRLSTRMDLLVAEYRRNSPPNARVRLLSPSDPRYPDDLLRLAGFQDEQRTVCLAEYARLAAEVPDDPQRASRIRERQVKLTALADEAADNLLRLLRNLVRSPELTPHLTDEWLYLYALELTARDHRLEATDTLARLAADFPRSPLLPHLKLVVAVHELTRGRLLRARQLFTMVLASPARELHAHARVGLGWSWLRAAPDAPLRVDLAVDNFIHAYTANPGAPLDPALRTSREDGLVHAYAAAGRPDRAAWLFTRLADTPGERRSTALLERLALAHFARGEHRESAAIYRALQALHPDDPRQCAWQARLLLAAIADRDPVARARETRRLADLDRHWTTAQLHARADRRRCNEATRALTAATP
jgi:hypothetical protein